MLHLFVRRMALSPVPVRQDVHPLENFAGSPTKVRPPAERVQIGNLRHQFLVARVHRGFNLADDSPRQLLLMRHQRLIFRQFREETKPH